MGAAKATYVEARDSKIQQIKEISREAYDQLDKLEEKTWCKHAFSVYPKCNVLMNNLCEAFNSTILVARDKPLLTMCDLIRKYVMRRFANLREKVDRIQGNAMPKPKMRLEFEKEKSGNWFATLAGNFHFEVAHSMSPNKFIVDLQRWSCTYNFWDVTRIPCKHAVAAINYNCQEPEDFVHWYYFK